MCSFVVSTRVCFGALSSTVSRIFSTAPSLLKDASQPLKKWTFKVSPFGKVNANLHCDLSVRPLDPHAYPEADRAFISVLGTNTDHESKLNDLHVVYSDQNKELLIHGDERTNSVTVELIAPIKSGEWCMWKISSCYVNTFTVI